MKRKKTTDDKPNHKTTWEMLIDGCNPIPFNSPLNGPLTREQAIDLGCKLIRATGHDVDYWEITK